MKKQYLFGIKYLIPYDRTTLKPKGIFEVIGGVEVGREIEQLFLNGGHKSSPFAVEGGEENNTMTATLREYPNFAFNIFENADITSVTTEASGYVGTPGNKVGSSIIDPTTGIASIAATATKESSIPSGWLLIQGTSDPTKVDIYLAGDVASGRVPIVDELPKIASDVVVAGTGGTVELADYGLTITGGSGTVAFTEGDLAYVDVRPANTKRTTIQVGANTGVNYVGMLLVYPRNSEKDQTIVRFPKVAVIGMPFNGNSREFSEFEQAMTPLYDDDAGVLYEIIRTELS